MKNCVNHCGKTKVLVISQPQLYANDRSTSTDIKLYAAMNMTVITILIVVIFHVVLYFAIARKPKK